MSNINLLPEELRKPPQAPPPKPLASKETVHPLPQPPSPPSSRPITSSPLPSPQIPQTHPNPLGTGFKVRRTDDLTDRTPTTEKQTSSAKITLIPGQSSSFTHQQPHISPQTLIPLITLGVVVLILGGMLVFTYQKRTELTSLTTTIDETTNYNQQLAQKLKEPLRRALQSEYAATRINAHTHYEAFFRLLEIRTLPEVHYERLAITEGLKISLSLLAPSFSAAAEQLMLLRTANNITGVTFSSLRREITPRGDMVRSEVQLSIHPSLLSNSL